MVRGGEGMILSYENIEHIAAGVSTSVFMLYSLEKTIDTAIIITSRAGMAIVRVEPQKLIKKNSQLSLYPYCKAVPTSGI